MLWKNLQNVFSLRILRSKMVSVYMRETMAWKPFVFTNKRTDGDKTLFTLNSSKVLPHSWSIREPEFVNSASNIRTSDSTTIKFDSNISTKNEKVKFTLHYTVAYGSSLNIAYDFNMTLPLY